MDLQTTVKDFLRKVQEMDLPPDLTIRIIFPDHDMPNTPEHLIPEEEKPRNYRLEMLKEMQRKYHGNEDSEAMIRLLKEDRTYGKEREPLV